MRVSDSAFENGKVHNVCAIDMPWHYDIPPSEGGT